METTWFHVGAVDVPEGSLSLARSGVRWRRPIRVTCRSWFPRSARRLSGIPAAPFDTLKSLFCRTGRGITSTPGMCPSARREPVAWHPGASAGIRFIGGFRSTADAPSLTLPPSAPPRIPRPHGVSQPPWMPRSSRPAPSASRVQPLRPACPRTHPVPVNGRVRDGEAHASSGMCGAHRGRGIRQNGWPAGSA
jgi:hypothetical protein